MPDPSKIGYPGAKNGAGIYHTIINNMPPHELYVEPFVGGGAILWRKRPAAATIVVDADPAVARHWAYVAEGGRIRGLSAKYRAYPGLTAFCGDGRSLIAGYADERDRRVLIYCDPPYVRSTRRTKVPIYAHEFTDEDHRRLLSMLLPLKCSVMISGYPCALYAEMLAGWRRVEMRTMTRGGQALECLWCNFPVPKLLHDVSYLGTDFRERERIKRKKERWRSRLAGLDSRERQAIMEVLRDLAPPKMTVQAFGQEVSADPAMPARVSGGGGELGQPRLI